MHGMRPLGALISKEDALARSLAAAAPIARVEEVPLERAAGRVLAEDLRAPFDVPPYARATMDGYAVGAGDGPWRVLGDLLAGANAIPMLSPGEAIRIATGAPVPRGARAVIRVEDTRERAGVVTSDKVARDGQNIERAGADLAKGDLIAQVGTHLGPAKIGLLASIGLARVPAFARPRIALFSTGDELLPVGAPPDPLRIYDSNGPTLSALFASHGAQVTHGRVRDSIDGLQGALEADADIVIFTGGASAGAKDLVVDAVKTRGEVLFHGVRVKPGKPLLVGKIGAKLVVGLPGNPTSALSNACLFVVPALRKVARLPHASPARADATLASAVRAEPDRFLFLPVRVDGDVATPTFKSSGALTSIAASDGWIGVPEGADLPAGTRVTVHAWW